MLDERLKTQILDILSQNLDIENFIVFLFGSFARGEEKKRSDIDVGVYCGNKLEDGTAYNIKEELNEEVGTLREIDFVDFAGVTDPVFFKCAVKEAVLWYQGKECKTSWENLKRLSES